MVDKNRRLVGHAKAAELRDRIAQLKGQPTMAPQAKKPRRRRR
jgi:hypothetical protein